MECGKLTAKLRDAVPVCFMVNDTEVKRYKNIEIPEEIKHLEFSRFRFDVPETGSITFKIWFDEGILPETWPATRERKSRTSPEPKPEQKEMKETIFPEFIELRFILESKEERKALAEEIGRHFGTKPEFLGVPSLAYRVGGYLLSKTGLLAGPKNQELIDRLINKGYKMVE